MLRQVRDIIVKNKVVQGIEIKMPKNNLIIIIGNKGYVMCGYLDIDVAEKFGDCAAIVRGVKTIDDLLEKKVVEVTSKAKKIGIKTGMTGLSAVGKML